jgi:aspartate-semialdehyde dehydrogenase
MKPQNVVVVGATGAVGQEMLRILAQRKFPLASLRLVASPGSAGKTVKFEGRDHVLIPPSREAFEGANLALFSAGASVSREWGPVAASCGALVVDNSSAFRMDADVPLVIPEVNPEAMKNRPRNIIANPNCTTIVMLTALKALHDAARIEHIVVSTYQAVSGKGARAVAELEEQMRHMHEGKEPSHAVLPGILAWNVLSDWKHEPSGYSEEESKVIAETRKILAMPTLHVSPTTTRVPVRVGHSESVWVRFEKPISRENAIELLRKAPGVQVDDRIGPGMHPQPRHVAGGDDVHVGRIRQDSEDPNALSLFVVGDNIRKGAAQNAIQIAEHILGG